MIQNADDAGATEVNFLYDNRYHGTNFLENPELAKFQGPALYCHNNAIFKKDDWEGIQNLMRSNKKDDPLKVGRFGIGFNSVYHITGEWVNKTALRINFIKVTCSYRNSYRGYVLRRCSYSGYSDCLFYKLSILFVFDKELNYMRNEKTSSLR